MTRSLSRVVALVLALILGHGFTQQPAAAVTRLVVFEGFYRHT